MVKIGALFAEKEEDDEHTTTTTTTTTIAPPRRARVREVSSRFMSPVVSSSSSGDLHLPASKCPLPKQQHHSHQSVQPDPEPLCSSYENRLDMLRSLRGTTPPSPTPHVPVPAPIQKKQQQQQSQKAVSAKKLYKENGGGRFSGSVRNACHIAPRPRPDTPTVHTGGGITQKSHPSTNIIGGVVSTSASVASTTAAAKLLQLSGMAASTCVDSEYGCSENPLESSKSTDSPEIEKSTIINGGNSPLKSSCKVRALPDFRSSMPEADLLPTISSRLLLAQRSCGGGSASALGDYSKLTNFPCYRSLSEHSFSSSVKSVNKSTSSLSKHHSSTTFKSLPPQPSNTKLGTEPRKGKKILSHQEDVHALRLLQNRYLQWRHANAKAEAAMNSQLISAKGSFNALVAKISELCDSVERKCLELGLLRRTGTLTTIIESQMPYLDHWSVLEGDYSSSLSGAIKALQDASLRLPITGNVRADIREVGGALNSASNVMEVMSSHVESFLPKAEEMDNLISELAGVVSRERALIEECGDLLTRTHILQVEECSLRGQLIQLK